MMSSAIAFAGSGATFTRLVPTRRATNRREVVLPCQVVRERDFRLIADRTLDVSLDGLLVPLRSRVLTGESLIVSFPIPGMWIDVEATIARVIHDRRPGDSGLAAGILFDPLAPAVRAALAGFLHGKREPLPRRGPLACLRRGAPPPRLADTLLMGEGVVEMVAPEDILSIEDAPPVERSEEEVDGLDVLRAVVGAWRSLTEAPPPDSDA